jgi:N-methylhydantoinase A/oxoprolinase/acetone carboxylase beta subunit
MPNEKQKQDGKVYHIGVDTGGTFTDVIVIDSAVKRDERGLLMEK